MHDIRKFWSLESKYKELNELYKRGIMLAGSSGSGKSCTLQLVCDELVNSGGLVIKFDNPELFIEAIRLFRQIEPNRNFIVVMEDLDGFLDDWPESTILNILDGVDQTNHVVFLATTNYPDKILGRLMNRPSRFDRVFDFGPPDPKVREFYLSNLVEKYRKNNKDFSIDIEKWIKDTDTLSIAHLKELFISVNIFEYDYNETLKMLKGMKKKLKAKDDEIGPEKVGF